MTDERLALIRAQCAQLRRRMTPEGAFRLLFWCDELLAELERWRSQQRRLDGEDAA